jgi:membrane-bound serine protease (ClpP class)
MEFLLNPNIAYLLLVLATFLILLAVAAPGTGMLEVSAVFCLLLAGYAVYHLSFHWWALLLIMLSLVPFFIAIRRPRREPWLIVSILGLTIGSVFFFPAEGGPISVNPFLALLTSALYAAFVWISVRKVMQVAWTKPAHDISTLVGQRGVAKTSVKDEGSVQVAGELWSARSERPIQPGSVVRVVGREGFILIVEHDRSS